LIWDLTADKLVHWGIFLLFPLLVHITSVPVDLCLSHEVKQTPKAYKESARPCGSKTKKGGKQKEQVGGTSLH
jgi:hypothetical protein